MAASDITVAGLTATNDVSGIKLSWTYSDPRSGALPNIALDMVEVHAATTNNRATATKVGEGITDFLHAGLGRGAVRYYWIKARDNLGGFGAWYPSSSTGGVQGTELSGDVSLTTDGYWKLPSGLIVQWGSVLTGAGDTAVSFPVAFPNNVFAVNITPAISSASGTYTAQLASLGLSSMSIAAFKIAAGGVITQPGNFVSWVAIGY